MYTYKKHKKYIEVNRKYTVNANVITALSLASCPASAMLLFNGHCTLHKNWTHAVQQIHKNSIPISF